MSGLNRVTLLGYVGADPELRNTAGGTAVLNLRLATSERYLDKNKEWQERTEWHSVVVWGARGTALSKLIVKGACVLIEGGLRTSSYEKDGVKRYKTEVHATEVCLAGGKAAPAAAAAELSAAEVTVVPRMLPARTGKKGGGQPALAFEASDQIPF